VLYFLLILFFNYFYVSIQYDTTEISNNIQKNGGFVPGIRPGENTVKYINKILNKTTLLGAVFLGIVAVLPLVLSLAMSVSVGLAGTSVLIIVRWCLRRRDRSSPRWSCAITRASLNRPNGGGAYEDNTAGRAGRGKGHTG